MAHRPTDELRRKVESYAAVGIPHDDIARVLGVTAKTLRRHYRQQLDTGATKANAAVGGAFYNNCIGGNVIAQIWWTKARMGWSERNERGADDRAALIELLKTMAENLPG